MIDLDMVVVAVRDNVFNVDVFIDVDSGRGLSHCKL